MANQNIINFRLPFCFSKNLSIGCFSLAKLPKTNLSVNAFLLLASGYCHATVLTDQPWQKNNISNKKSNIQLKLDFQTFFKNFCFVIDFIEGLQFWHINKKKESFLESFEIISRVMIDSHVMIPMIDLVQTSSD